MPLPKYLTTVTVFSKYLAMFVFIILPFLGLYIGMQYQSKIDGESRTSASYPAISSNHHTLKAMTSVSRKSTEAQISPSSEPPLPTGIPLASNGYFTIYQWHIRAPYHGSLALEYSPPPPGSQPAMQVSAAQLNAGGPSSLCTTAERGAGYIARYLPTDEVGPRQTAQQYLSQNFKDSNSNAPPYAKIGKYYYIYFTGQAPNCNNLTLLVQTQKVFEKIVPQLVSY